MLLEIYIWGRENDERKPVTGEEEKGSECGEQWEILS